jgi:hypothetical protein
MANDNDRPESLQTFLAKLSLQTFLAKLSLQTFLAKLNLQTPLIVVAYILPFTIG